MNLRQLLALAAILAFGFVNGDARGESTINISNPEPYSKETGAAIGTLRASGQPAPGSVLKVHKERGFCGSLVPDQRVIVSPDGGLKNVVVTLHGPGLAQRVGQRDIIELDNVGCRFAPHVQAARAGSTLQLFNSDRILHDAHARMGSRTLFNDGLPRWRRTTRTLHRPGVVKIICELHRAWMSAFIVVTPNPFFAVTDSQGRYAIRGIPPGVYEARFWHETLGRASRRILVNPAKEWRTDVILPQR